MKPILSLSVLLLVSCLSVCAQEFTIKFATVAPDGSAWMEVMKEYDAAVRKESGGRVGFRIYPGMVQGDERTVLRKIKIGQLHAGGFTGVALGEIAPRVRVLDSPFLVNSYEEVDHLYKEFDAEFQKAFEEGGYVLLGWAEVGFVHVFCNTKIRGPADLKTLKMWTWEGDPIAETAFRTLGINPIPLSITDVLTSLQTGLVDAFYVSPLGALALQWYTRVKYVIDVPLADAAGAVVISKNYFEKMPKELQDIILRNGRQYMAKLVQVSRRENAKAMEEMLKRGLTLLKADPKDIPFYAEVGQRSRRMLVGKLYTEEFLNRVEKSLVEFRKHRSTSQ
jgi:TRAP-type C4-dicarboxylate transport system substrate-binding protein